MIDSLSSGAWHSIDAPTPPGGNGASLAAVSCIARGACTAVGDFAPSGDTLGGLIDTLSGGSWTGSQAPSPGGGSGQLSLTSVSCASDDTCAAVGEYGENSDTSVPVADSFTGGSWTASVVPIPGDATNRQTNFGPVSCSPGLACAAVGSNETSTSGPRTFAFISTTSGGPWSSVQAPLPAGAAGAISSGLSQVSCPTSIHCFAIGEYATTSGSSQVIEAGINLSLPDVVTGEVRKPSLRR